MKTIELFQRFKIQNLRLGNFISKRFNGSIKSSSQAVKQSSVVSFAIWNMLNVKKRQPKFNTHLTIESLIDYQKYKMRDIHQIWCVIISVFVWTSLEIIQLFMFSSLRRHAFIMVFETSNLFIASTRSNGVNFRTLNHLATHGMGQRTYEVSIY